MLDFKLPFPWTWNSIAPSDSPRKKHKLLVYEEMLYMVGFSTAIQRYDPGTDQWTNVAELPVSNSLQVQNKMGFKVKYICVYFSEWNLSMMTLRRLSIIIGGVFYYNLLTPLVDPHYSTADQYLARRENKKSFI